MRIVLADVQSRMRLAWKKFFAGTDVEVYEGGISSIFDVKVDALVSPANSFGFMDGGIDEFYCEYLGWEVQTKLQEIIKKQFNGELLIGQAACVPTGQVPYKYVISAPTMRVPAILPKNTVNAFLATRAALLVAKSMHKAGMLESLVFPGMGTGIGKIGFEQCALQMREAYDFAIGEKSMEFTWANVLDHNTYLYTGLRATQQMAREETNPVPE